MRLARNSQRLQKLQAGITCMNTVVDRRASHRRCMVNPAPMVTEGIVGNPVKSTGLCPISTLRILVPCRRTPAKLSVEILGGIWPFLLNCITHFASRGGY